MPIFGVLGSIGAIAKGIKGKKQRKEAAKIDDTRPVYKRPEEIDQNVQQYRNLSQGGQMPGQQLMQRQLGQQTAQASQQVQQATGSASSRLAAISGLNQQRQDAQTQLGIQGAQFSAGAMDKLAQARTARAGYKDLEFDYNKNQEFQYNRRRKNMLTAAADANNMGMWQDFQSQVNSAANMGMQAMSGKREAPGLLRRAPIRRIGRWKCGRRGIGPRSRPRAPNLARSWLLRRLGRWRVGPADLPSDPHAARRPETSI